MPRQLSQSKIFPAHDSLHNARDQRACRQHQRGIGRKISRDFDAVSARSHPDRATLPIGRQQHDRYRQDMGQQIGKLRRIAKL